MACFVTRRLASFFGISWVLEHGPTWDREREWASTVSPPGTGIGTGREDELVGWAHLGQGGGWVLKTVPFTVSGLKLRSVQWIWILPARKFEFKQPGSGLLPSFFLS